MVEAWYTHEQFPTVVEKAWEYYNYEIMVAMRQFKILATHWNTKSFGNIMGRKKVLLVRLDEIQRNWSNDIRLIWRI